ncbi:MAG TPA: hypothetical protein PK402_02900, partial [Tepidisphaeraceae bacterium]|nr:hypothetical protein [Tepidisphaeraceae bacterium]
MSVVEESLSAALDFLLATDGTLIGQARALGDVDVTTQLGKPLSETYWFRHSDTDERELTNLIRDASNGKAERLRVWVRVSEHQLVRCDLLVTPITGPGGEVTHISARTEPTPSTPRRRGPVEPIVKAISTQASPSNPTDLLQLRLSIPMMRVELSTLTVLQANDALLELFELPLEVFPKPLVDFIDSSERASVLDALNQFRSTQIDRTIDTRLIRKHLTFEAGLSISIDPIDAEANSVLITIKDRSAERIATDLVQRAEQLAAQSARQDSTLRTLERLINACPIPIGVIEDGKISHASQSLRDRFDHEALSSLIANKRSTPRSDVISLDEQGHIFGVIATTPVALNAIDPSTLLAIATIDLHGRIHHWNATFARWAGATETQAPRGLFDALDTESRLALEVSLRKFEN